MSVFGIGEDPVLGLFLAVFTFAIILIMVVRPALPVRLADGWTGRDYTNSVPDLLGSDYEIKLDISKLPRGIWHTNGVLNGRPDKRNIAAGKQFRDFYIPAEVIPRKRDSLSSSQMSKLTVRFQLRVWNLPPIEIQELLPQTRANQNYLGAIVAWGGSGRLRWSISGDRSVEQMLNNANGILRGRVPSMMAADGRPVSVPFRVRVEDEDGLVPALTTNFQIRVLPPMQFFAPE
jgi:hypothetical protein